MAELSYNDIRKLQKEARQETYTRIIDKITNLRHKVVDDTELLNNIHYLCGLINGFIISQGTVYKLLKDDTNVTKS